MTTELRKAVTRVAEGLERGDYEHRPYVPGSFYALTLADTTIDGKRLFNMMHWRGRAATFKMQNWRWGDSAASFVAELASCGTVCCIGGWIEYELGRKLPLDQAESLIPLTSPPFKIDWNAITPAQAAAATRRWLNGDKTPWAKP